MCCVFVPRPRWTTASGSEWADAFYFPCAGRHVTSGFPDETRMRVQTLILVWRFETLMHRLPSTLSRALIEFYPGPRGFLSFLSQSNLSREAAEASRGEERRKKTSGTRVIEFEPAQIFLESRRRLSLDTRSRWRMRIQEFSNSPSRLAIISF